MKVTISPKVIDIEIKCKLKSIMTSTPKFHFSEIDHEGCCDKMIKNVEDEL